MNKYIANWRNFSCALGKKTHEDTGNLKDGKCYMTIEW